MTLTPGARPIVPAPAVFALGVRASARGVGFGGPDLLVEDLQVDRAP